MEAGGGLPGRGPIVPLRLSVHSYADHSRALGRSPMKDHLRILGTLFIAWAVLQVSTAVLAVFTVEPRATAPALFWGALALIALAYGWFGYQLRRHSRIARVPAIVLSVFALLSFPFGTALGIYGLWVLLRRHPARTAS